jgi:predicted Na+-dependent transporter
VIQGLLFMAIVPFALAMVLVFAHISGRMSQRLRCRLEWAMVATLYPLMILYFSWRAWEAWQRADWIEFSLPLVAAVIFSAHFVLSLRSGSLFPRFRNQKG